MCQLIRFWSLSCSVKLLINAPISIFPQRGSGGDTTRGIRLQTNPNFRELDTAPKPCGGKLDTSFGISKLNYITNLMAHPRDFRHHIFTKGWGIRPQFFKIV